jgi:hypothetical protein
VDVFEEWDQTNEVLVVRVALPWLQNDGVLGLLSNMALIGVDDNDLREIAVEVGKILRESVQLSPTLDLNGGLP